ncbi:unnamed protein product [Rhizoctonia solani]|nr:unnamed protein product [Rhizoctonia solani]
MKRVINSDTRNTLSGPIVDWCKNLHNSTVYKIQLLSSSRSESAPLFVVVSLQDGSMYRLQRTVKWAKKQIMPNIQDIQDTIEEVSALDIAGSQPFITIKFKAQYYPNLLFLLQVCHSIQVCHDIQGRGMIFKAPHVIMVCSDDFFALALVLNVTRNCLPRRSIVDTSESQPDSYILLEGLWQEIYQTLQRQGHAFWERTMAEHTKGLARELIYGLARHKVLRLLRGNTGPINELSVAASMVARIEALVEKKELIDPIVWDKAWDKAWEKAWKQRGSVVQPYNPGRIQAFTSRFRSTSTNTNIAIVDGRVSGRAAGRAPVKLLPTGSSSILLSSIVAGVHSQPTEIIAHSAEEASTPGDGNQSLNHISSEGRHSLVDSNVSTSNLYRASIAERYDCTVNWLGNSCLLSDLNTCKIWATPRESAIESAWGVAWSQGEIYGRAAARGVLGVVDQPLTQPTTSGIRSRARTISKAVTHIMTQASHRLSISPNREHIQELPAIGTPRIGTAFSRTSLANTAPLLGTNPSAVENMRISAPKNIISDFETSSPPAMRLQFEVNRPSPIVTRRRSSRLMTPSTPTNLYPISEVSSRVDLPALSPATRIAETAPIPFPVTTPVLAIPPQSPDHSIPPSGVTTPRPRSESATKRLRKHVITRWSDPQPYGDFEAAFRDKTQERKYRESKGSSCKEAAQCIHHLELLEKKLREVDPMKQATEAWDRANSISDKALFQQKLKALAQQEWEKMVSQHERISFAARPENEWEIGFISAWEQVWKESWAEAWAAVWRLSFDEAVSRGIEFGVDETIGNLASELRRRTYEQLQSSDPYVQLQRSLPADTSPLGSLEQIHQWMQELGYLSELLHHSAPILRNECMEITVVESKVTCDDQ